MDIIDDEDLKIARMVCSEKIEHISQFTFGYLKTDKTGTTREKEIHELALFSTREMMDFSKRVDSKQNIIQQNYLIDDYNYQTCLIS